jgi:hypothetical protein
MTHLLDFTQLATQQSSEIWAHKNPETFLKVLLIRDLTYILPHKSLEKDFRTSPEIFNQCLPLNISWTSVVSLPLGVSRSLENVFTPSYINPASISASLT